MRQAVTSIGLATGIVLGVSFSAKAALATDYFVSSSGNDAASGLSGAPFKTIQKAVDSAQAGDSVTVDDGTYAGFWMKSRGGAANARIVIRSKNKGGAKITTPSATASDPADLVQLVSVSYVTIDGFDVSGAARAGISIRTLGDVTGADTTDDVVQHCHSHDNGGGTTAGRHDGIFTGFARNVTIVNNEVNGNAEHGIYVSNSADNPTISGNVSHENKANGLQINADVSTGGDGIITGWKMETNVVWGNGGAAGINLDGACNGLLRNNLIYGNVNGGITLFQGDAASASQGNVIANNTIYNPSGTRSGIQIANGANDNVVFNNVFFSAAAGMEIQTVTGLVHDYNVVSSYSGGGASAHESPSTAALMFVSAASNDYRPALALIGKGIGTLGGDAAPTTDLSGASRGSTEDIGCYASGSGAAGGGSDAGASGGGGGSSGDGGGSTSGGGTGSDAGDGGSNGGGATPDAGTGGSAGGGATSGGGNGATGTSAGENGGSSGASDTASTGGCSFGGTSPASGAGAALLAAGLLALSSRRARRAQATARSRRR